MSALAVSHEHDTVLDGLVELVGVDKRAERFDTRGFVGFEQGSAGEADEHRAGEQMLHGGMHLAGLGAVRFVDEDEQIALGFEVFRDLRIQLFDEIVARFIEIGV